MGMARTFNQWQYFTKNQIYKRDLCWRVLSRFDNKTLNAGFRRWQSFVSSHKHNSEIRALKNTIKAQEMEKQKLLCHRVFQRIVNRNLVLAWESWQDHVRSWRLLEKISARFRNQGMARTFNQWQYFTKNQIYKRDLCWRVLSRFDNKTLNAGFRRWQSFVSSHKHNSEIRALKNKIKAQEMEKQKLLCHRVFQRIVNRNLVLAWE